MRRAVTHSVLLALICLFIQVCTHHFPAESVGNVTTCFSVGPTVLISELYPWSTNDDEYFSLFNRGETAVSLNGWQVTDGEGSISFLEGVWMPSMSYCSVTFNGSSYLAAYGVRPSVAFDEPASGNLCGLAGSFKLGNDGDSLVLLDPRGEVMDSVVYGASADLVESWDGDPVPSPRMGEVIRRLVSAGVPQDTDSACDWTPFREHRYGYTTWRSESYDIGPGGVTAFVSPDCTIDVVLELLGKACDAIRLCTYELSSPTICRALLDSSMRGVEVSLFVDGSPAGGMSDDAVGALSVLTASGVQVRTLSGSLEDDIVRHVLALHSKYMVIDSNWTVVMSENAVPGGMSVDRVFGNRGWGVAVRSVDLARFMTCVFDDDCRDDRRDVLDWRLDPRYDPDAVLPDREVCQHPEGMISPYVSAAQSQVTILFSPDSSETEPFMLERLSSASSILVEQFQADLKWRTRWSEVETLNPLVLRTMERARAGASSRMLFDSSWFNIERNSDVVDALSVVSYVESLECSAKLLDRRSPVTVLHNKGAIIDDTCSVVPSNNWVYASFARNREVAAVIDSAEIARFFTRAFDADWYPDVNPPVIDMVQEVQVVAGSWVNLSAAGCHDDRGIADVAWDVGQDGVTDSTESGIRLLVPFPGETVVLLTVTDAWGNDATARVTIRASGGVQVPVAGERNAVGQYVSPAAVVIASAVAVLLASRGRASRCR